MSLSAAGRHSCNDRAVVEDDGASAMEHRVGAHPGTRRQPTILETGLIAARLHRPYDLVAAIGCLVAGVLIVLVGLFAANTSSGVQADLATVGSKVPAFFVVALNLAAGISFLVFPIAVSIDLLVRRRFRQCIDSLIALGATMSVVAGAGWLVEHYASASVRLALAGATRPELGNASSPLLAATVAFAVVARLAGRSGWRGFALALITTATIITSISGGITLSGVLASVAVGAFVGYLLRWLLGVTSTRPRGQELIAALRQHGYDVTELRVATSTERGREYAVATTQGPLQVQVLDRDLEGGDLLRNLRNGFRVRGAASPGVTVRRSVDRAALMSYALERAGVPTRTLVAAHRINDESALIAYKERSGVSLDRWHADSEAAAHDIVTQLWQIVATAHSAGIALRDTAPNSFSVDDDGRLWIRNSTSGSVAADDVQLRIDIAMTLVTAAALTDVDTAVGGARAHLNDDQVIAALPALQRFAMPESMRTVIHANRGLLRELRQAVAAVAPEAPIADIRIERVRPRSVLTVILGAAAAYLLVAQLSQVSATHLWHGYDNRWLFVALAGSAVTYAAMTMIMIGHLPQRPPVWRTFLTQWAASVANLMTPSSLGTVAMNIRFFTRLGVPVAVAVAGVGLSQVTGVVIHVLMLVTAAAITGSSGHVAFTIPAPVGILVISVIAAIISLISIPRIRISAYNRVKPFVLQVVPRFVTMAKDPRKVSLGLGGQLLINSAYIATLYASVRAAGGHCSFSTAALVYLAGATIGQAVPTPGGLGGIEALLTASLTTAGIPLDQAVVSTLVFRLVTFWLPLVPGWFALRFLTSKNAL